MESITTKKGREKAAKLSKGMNKSAGHYGDNVIHKSFNDLFGKKKTTAPSGSTTSLPKQLSANQAAYAKDVARATSKARLGASIGAGVLKATKAGVGGTTKMARARKAKRP